MIRYHFEGATHYIVHGVQVLAAVGLGVLGVLSAGNPENRKVYALLKHQLLIAIVAAVYTFVNVFILVRP